MKKLLLTLLIAAGLASVCSAQQAFYDVIAANGNGIRFWQDDRWKIHMGNLSEYHYGPVSDYSIKTNMDATAGRGWTWGTSGSIPVAAIDNAGKMQIAGTFQSYNLKAWAGNSYNTFGSTQLQLSFGGGGGSVSYAHAIKSRHMSASLAGNAIDFYLWQPGDNINGEGSLNVMSLNGGNVGIGTTSPNSKLVISDGSNNAISINAGAGASALGFNRNVLDGAIFNPSISAWQFSARDDRFTLEGYNGPSQNLFTVLKNGNAGIGTVSPTARLEVNQVGGGSGQNVALKTWAGNNNDYFGNSQIQFTYGGGGGYSHAIKSRHNSAAKAGNAIDFFLWQPGDPVNGEGSLATLSLNGGNVGIGTNNPIYGRLHVTQSSDDSDHGIAIHNSTQVRAMRLWTDPNNSYVYSGGTGQANLILNNTGYVGIGTTSPDAKLAVAGQVHAQEVKVSITVPGPDYVFEKDYQLTSLEEIKNFIDQNKHLPEVPSAAAMEKNGVQLGEMNMLLLKKIEELTLYCIEMNKKVEELRRENNDQNKMIKELIKK